MRIKSHVLISFIGVISMMYSYEFENEAITDSIAYQLQKGINEAGCVYGEDYSLFKLDYDHAFSKMNRYLEIHPLNCAIRINKIEKGTRTIMVYFDILRDYKNKIFNRLKARMFFNQQDVHFITFDALFL